MDASIRSVCTQVRRNIINMTANAGCGHPGGSLSIVEALVALYFEKMNIDPQNPKMEDRDRFVLSKGHAAPALYGVLAERGYFSRNEFANFRQYGSFLQGHPDMKRCPGVDASTGSLGQGLSIGLGMALGQKAKGIARKTYVLCGDGELAEGQNWEAIMAAGIYKCDNLVAIVDQNGLQATGPVKERFDTNPLPEKWKAFGWNVIEIDGHDMEQILTALDTADTVKEQPTVIIAHTVKGKGVSFAENVVGFHNGILTQELYDQALQELS